ncbi:uncharacterized protein LOC112568731 isoform X2 [Pomacea canaliculata]|uniref:uncharacterized protein LOC112568731 isoform X2 n=1 Tax=Pomacea canaliculata TaxID=400727 RepID=UPI000D725E93|nr:uncharacterized protein LOC112568731 isoform X2 [Pomacea canaliculata]
MAVWSLWILCGVALLAVKVDSAIYIRVCSDEKRTVIEDTNVTFICGQYQNQVEWSWSYPNNWQWYGFGSCNRTGCRLYNGVTLPVKLSKLTSSSSWIYESQLDINVVTRYQAYAYHCRDTDSGRTATCGLRLIAPAIISGDSCSVRVSKWQIYGTCAVERMYASDDVYTCIWRKNNNQIQEGFQEPITYYTFGSRSYRRGVCSFSQNMPVSQGNYNYSMDIDPGSQNFFYKTINIVPPDEPSHDCPETVFEGSDITCKCTSSNLGTPPAEFAWDGIGTDTLFLQDIQPKNTTINYSCRLIWGPDGYINSSIVYTLRIAENEREKNTKGGIIGGCVAAVFILAIIGIVIAVYIVKRRKAPLYDTARRPANNEHSYDDLTQKSGDTPQSPEIRDGMIANDNHCYEEVILERPNATQPTVAIFVVPRTSQTVSSP